MNHLFITNKLNSLIKPETLLILPKNSGLESYKKQFLELENEKIVVRAEDVPIFIEKLQANNINCVGITGEDLFFEYSLKNKKNKKLKVIQKIDWNDNTALFRRPTICLLGKKELFELNGAVVAINNKYANIASEFLSNYQPKEIIFFNGATELAVTFGIADFVIDIVYSGFSANEAGLKVVSKIFESNIVILEVEK